MTIRIQELSKLNSKLLNANLRAIILLCILIYGLAIFQDYLFSRFKSTGFYWSDTMLYNIYWLFFIPFIKLATYTKTKIQPKIKKTKILYGFASGFIFTALHISIFSIVFILGSNLIYEIPHRFSTIFKNAISSQSQITILVYLCLPFVIDYLNRKKNLNNNVIEQKFITVKNGTRITKLDVSKVLVIKTDRPYTVIFSLDQKLLHDESLKKLESLLDPKIFIRVHRSAIINKNHIKEISSRKNGDYDAILTNQHSVRLSRHYRPNWNTLLNH
ncbi:MAG: LytTR family DNA-binding domain-containing protein [Bacteroidota bacterium]|uniref:LytR/AlgR family response regulator transcription factor n=1 Tax=Leeuwenhoekiella palythoae TaxID=573501 RepID=UPI001CE0D183|nr:LytTR family DNA-binding domain-containing protein [Leeuwenhoekiella palythoae]MEC7782545.1 LytTR family DNA-binding domain-containing protein [Bacteroidota bacterium]UBZ11384.1 LytTR family transcriptional regulator [Leeuwenhoekiella palythoae]